MVDCGFAHKIAWQTTVGTDEFIPRAFVREAAWVVLSSGMRESAVRALFKRLAQTLHDFDPAAMSADRQMACPAAFTVLGHEGKLATILDIAVNADRLDDDRLKGSDPQP